MDPHAVEVGLAVDPNGGGGTFTWYNTSPASFKINTGTVLFPTKKSVLNVKSMPTGDS